jgi:hypothetical protein
LEVLKRKIPPGLRVSHTSRKASILERNLLADAHPTLIEGGVGQHAGIGIDATHAANQSADVHLAYDPGTGS